MKNTKKKIIKITGITLTAILLIVCIGVAWGGNYFTNYALKRSENVTATSFSSPHERQWFSEHAKSIYITSSDGLKLHAYLIENQSAYKNGNFMMVFHGYKSNATAMAHFGMQFYDMGYSVLMPDARAHGKSEGKYIGMGWPERLDNLLWINEIIKIDSKAKIGLYGISMGGSTVINTAGEDLPKQVVVAVEDCGYSSAYDEFAHQMKSQFKIDSFPMLDISLLVASIKTGVNLTEGDCVTQAAKIKIPTLFIHGDQDSFVPFDMLDKLYKAANCKKQKLVVEGAGHGQSAIADPLLYWTTIEQFVGEAML